LSQEGVSVEVIVADDCSTDGTREILTSITDPRLKLLPGSQNGGPGAARNRAIQAAQGEWLAILDGDDRFAPGRLAAMLACAAAAQADIVVDDLLICHEADGSQAPMFGATRLSTIPYLTPESFIAGNLSFTSGYGLGYMKPLFRADFLRTHGLAYREEIRIGEDYVLLLSALALGAQCEVLPKAGYYYTVRKGSISHRLTKEDVERIEREDARLFAAHAFSEEAKALQEKRLHNLRQAYDYNALVEAIKGKRWWQAWQLAFANPRAARHLWLPIRKRIVGS
jgi:succinoglycan biosynthesis protein ExoO